MDMTPEIQRALAAYLGYLRSDWSYPYILAAVEGMARNSTDVERVTRVAVRGALSRRANGDWTLAKPDPLAMNGEHWKAQSDTAPEPPRPAKCDSCHQWHSVGGECTPRRSSEKRTEWIDALRGEYTKARSGLCGHGVPTFACTDHKAEAVDPEKEPDHA